MSKRNIQQNKSPNIKKKSLVKASSFVVYAPRGTPACLFSYVHKSASCAVLSMLLLSSFLLQGVYVVHASEPAEGELVVVPIEVDETDEAPVEQAQAEESSESVSDEEPPSGEDDVTAELAETDPVADPETPGVEDSDPVEPETGDSPETLPGDSDEGDYVPDPELPPVADEGDLEPGDESQPDGEEVDDPIDSDDPQASTTATTTPEEPIGPGLNEPVGVTYSDSGFTFSKSECTELASGSFYCLEPQENVLEDALFAAPDADGDLEIFLVRNGEQLQVTDNLVDDAAPFYDANSDTIVWHRLIDDRYQIILYTLEDGEEKQLTSGGANNMEPIKQGKYLVWQRWVKNNWEVVLFDGEKEKQISESTAHDIAPYIHGTLVVWNRYTLSGEKTIEMFDIKSETYVSVNDPDGLSVTNPRMVLVYDQMHPNGDIVTKGFDMIERKFVQLDTLPRQLPDSIPESEPTSEPRALVQSKPVVKGDEQVPPDIPKDSDPQGDNDLASTTDEYTLDMKAEVVGDTSLEPTPEITEYDLVIPATTTLSVSD
jgi:hypothetical protein